MTGEDLVVGCFDNQYMFWEKIKKAMKTFFSHKQIIGGQYSRPSKIGRNLCYYTLLNINKRPLQKKIFFEFFNVVRMPFRMQEKNRNNQKAVRIFQHEPDSVALSLYEP